MDVLNILSRWVVCKRIEMHQLFEQWAQQGTKKDVSVVRSAKRGLTHTSTELGMLDVFKQLPSCMTRSGITSDKYPYQSQVGLDEGSDMTGHMTSPVMGPFPNHTGQSAPSNCHQTKGQSVLRSFLQPKAQNRFHRKCSPEAQPFNATSTTMGAKFPLELSKSSMWKHIYAPPFTPAAANNKYPYGMVHRDPVSGADLSGPYAQRFSPAPNTMHSHSQALQGSIQQCGYPGVSYLQGIPCPESTYYRRTDIPAPVPTLPYGPSPCNAQPVFVPCIFRFTEQPAPIEVHHFQGVFVAQDLNQRDIRLNACSAGFTAESSLPEVNISHQEVELTSALPQTKNDISEIISEVVNGLQAVHLASQSCKVEGVKEAPIAACEHPKPPGVKSPEIEVSKAKCKESDCDIYRNTSLASSELAQSASTSGEKQSLNMSHIESDSNMNQSPEPRTPKSSSIKNCNVYRQPPKTTPSSNPRKKRKSRPSAEKRRRRRLAAECSTSTMQPRSRDRVEQKETSQSKKLKTNHQLSCSSLEPSSSATMSATVAFILGIDSDEESCDTSEDSPVKATPVKTYCFSISSCDSDSDFDEVDCGHGTTDSVLDDVAWGQFNFSLNPFNFHCLNSTSKPIKKTMSSPELMLHTTSKVDIGEQYQRKSLSPSHGGVKHVKFAIGDGLVTVHTLDDELDAYQEARKGPWEVYALDRCRFADRTKEVEKCISWIFNADHRRRVRSRLYDLGEEETRPRPVTSQ